MTLFAGTLTLAACGGSGGGGGGSTSESSPHSVSGVVDMGAAVEGATVEVYELDVSDGDAETSSSSGAIVSGVATEGERVAGPVTTDSKGKWEVEIPDEDSGPWVVAASGGTMALPGQDESVTFNSDKNIRSVITDADHQIAVTQATEALSRRTLSEVTPSDVPGQGIAGAVMTFRANFASRVGFNPVTSMPRSDSSTTSNQQFATRASEEEGVSLVGFTNLRHDSMTRGLIDYAMSADYDSVRSSVGTSGAIQTAACDLADGALDGLDQNGEPCDGVFVRAGIDSETGAVDLMNKTLIELGHDQALHDDPQINVQALREELAQAVFLNFDPSANTPNPGHPIPHSPYMVQYNEEFQDDTTLSYHAGSDFRTQVSGVRGLHWVTSPVKGTVRKTHGGGSGAFAVSYDSDGDSEEDRTLYFGHLYKDCRVPKGKGPKTDLTREDLPAGNDTETRDKKTSPSYCPSARSGDSLAWSVGATVQIGDVIGLSGSRGAGSAPHLHVEVRAGVQSAPQMMDVGECQKKRRVTKSVDHDDDDATANRVVTVCRRAGVATNTIDPLTLISQYGAEQLDTARGNQTNLSNSGGQLTLVGETLKDGSKVTAGADQVKRWEFEYKGDEAVEGLEAQLTEASQDSALKNLQETISVGDLEPGDNFVIQEGFTVPEGASPGDEFIPQWKFVDGSGSTINVAVNSETFSVFQLSVVAKESASAGGQRVAYYPFEASNRLADDSDNTNDGVERGGSVSYDTGVSGDALALGDDTAYVKVFNSSSLSMSDNFTYSAWFYLESESPSAGSGSDHTVLAQSGDQSGLTVGVSGDLSDVYAKSGSGDTLSAASVIDQSLELKSWHRVTVTRDDGITKLYLDGQFADSMGPDDFDVPDGMQSEPLRIGIGQNANENPLHGCVDEVSVYNRPLTRTEVEDSFNAPSGSTCSSGSDTSDDSVSSDGLLARYPYDGSLGDSTGNGWNPDQSYNTSFESGQVGQAVSFSGSDSGIILDDPEKGGDSIFGGESFFPRAKRTVAIWFRADATGGKQMLYEEGGASNGWNIYLDGRTLYVGGWSEDRSWFGEWVSASLSNATGTWHHAALVFDYAGTGKMKLFVDGDLTGTKPAATKMNWHPNEAGVGVVVEDTKFHTGDLDQGEGVTAKELSGDIDELRIYDRALSSDEVWTLANP